MNNRKTNARNHSMSQHEHDSLEDESVSDKYLNFKPIDTSYGQAKFPYQEDANYEFLYDEEYQKYKAD